MASFLKCAAVATSLVVTLGSEALAAQENGKGIAWPPYVNYGQDGLTCTSVPRDRARTILGIRIDEQAVEVAERVLGPSPLHQEGDASEYVAWRCWLAANGDGTLLYVFRGEVGGGMRILGREMAFSGRGSCPKSSLVHRRVATADGLHLDLARDDVVAKIGPPSRTGRNWLERTCCAMRPMTKTGPDVCSNFRAVLVDGKVAGLAITWTETD